MKVTYQFTEKELEFEEWKPIKNYEGVYEVSSLGRIRSFVSIGGSFEGKVGGRRIVKTFKILKLSTNEFGYPIVSLCINYVKKTKKVHRIVAETFIPNLENKRCINHINGIKIDNRVENLEWCTHSENLKHAFRTNLRSPIKGENNIRYKGNILAFNKEGKHVFTFKGPQDMKDCGFNPSMVYRCITGKFKSHRKYTFKRISKDPQKDIKNNLKISPQMEFNL